MHNSVLATDADSSGERITLVENSQLLEVEVASYQATISSDYLANKAAAKALFSFLYLTILLNLFKYRAKRTKKGFFCCILAQVYLECAST